MSLKDTHNSRKNSLLLKY